jgi:hypothetical protein
MAGSVLTSDRRIVVHRVRHGNTSAYSGLASEQSEEQCTATTTVKRLRMGEQRRSKSRSRDTHHPTSGVPAPRNARWRLRAVCGKLIHQNIVIEAKDIEAAKYKLRQRYPDCEILEGREK